MNIASITSSAMIGSLNISVWEARIQDKTTRDEVLGFKGARSKKAASVSKHLFSECPSLEAIKALRGEARIWFNQMTLPWDDNGGRLITTRQYLRVMDDYAKLKTKFEDAVRLFVSVYQTEISKQAFENGALFNRAEYPTEDEVAGKFRFALSVTPVPTSGDFRVDIGIEAQRQLTEQFEKAAAERVAAAMAEPWQRIKEHVERVRERMEAVLGYDPDKVEETPLRGPVKVGTEEVPEFDDDGNVVGTTTRDIVEERVISVEIKKPRRPKLYDSLRENGLELCTLLSDLNVTNDPRLEEARRDLERAMTRIDMDSLKESTELQHATKRAMDDILDKFAL